jgi:hypothetical protein
MSATFVPLPALKLYAATRPGGRDVDSVKVAVTVVAAFNKRRQLPTPSQPLPVQPVKREPLAGVAPSVTEVTLE